MLITVIVYLGFLETHFEMVLEFDCRLYCDNLKETKPPYKCPLEECDKVYKTFQGIQYHLFNFHNNSARKPQRSGGINKRWHHRHLQNSVSSLESVRPPVQEVLSPRSPNGTNEQTVEINFDGKLQKINIYEALEVCIFLILAYVCNAFDLHPVLYYSFCDETRGFKIIFYFALN